MELIIQPDDGIAPLISLIKGAKERVDIAIFRFDRRDLEKALRAAIDNGVKVNALIASANRGGEKTLRKLEMKFLEAGMTVARTDTDLIRYHDKVILIDGKTLCVLAFNFTYIDMDRSRSFGIVTENAKWVAEATKLLDSDSKRTPYAGDVDTFVVSPANARKALGNFLKGAKKQLWIYDPKISDREMIRILRDRAKNGVDVRIIGETKAALPVRKLSKLRLHTRTIVRDGEQVFIGSQSLRAAELDSRREVGVIVRDDEITKKVLETFEADWASGIEQKSRSTSARVPATPEEQTERAMQVLQAELHPIANTVKKAVEKVVAQAGEDMLDDEKVKETMKKVVKRVVKQAVKEAVRVST